MRMNVRLVKSNAFNCVFYNITWIIKKIQVFQNTSKFLMNFNKYFFIFSTIVKNIFKEHNHSVIHIG